MHTPLTSPVHTGSSSQWLSRLNISPATNRLLDLSTENIAISSRSRTLDLGANSEFLHGTLDAKLFVVGVVETSRFGRPRRLLSGRCTLGGLTLVVELEQVTCVFLCLREVRVEDLVWMIARVLVEEVHAGTDEVEAAGFEFEGEEE